MLKIGFSKVDLAEALLPKQPIREPIEAIALYAENEFGKTLWITLDFMDFNLGYTNAVRASVCKATGLGDFDVHVLTTHNHGGGNPDREILSSLCGRCALEAKNSARAAKMRFAFTESDTQLNILRRLYVPEIEGVSTLFFGACELNDFNASLFSDRVVRELKEGKVCNNIGEQTDREYERFKEADKEIFAIQFVGEDDTAIGSIVRFAAHAVTANRPGSFSSDYPYYVRCGLEREFGGICMFFNGPCGEIAPAMLNKSEGREKTLGYKISSLAISALKKAAFTDEIVFSHSKFEIKLPVREEVIADNVVIPDVMPEALPERKRYLEKKILQRTMPFLREKYTVSEDSLSDKISVYIGVLTFGDINFVAFPGETFNKTGRDIKDYFEGKNIVTVTEHERTVMYLPPE